MVTARVSRNIVLFALKELEGFDLHVQKQILEKVVGHSLLQSFLPEYLTNLQAVKNNLAIVENLNCRMASHLVGVRESHSVMAKDIVCTLASSTINSRSGRGIAKALDIDRRNFMKDIQRRNMFDMGSNAFWISYKKATCSDVLQESMKLLVIA